ncbi:MAG TPA: hypothetical protein VFH27_12820 [Longimicrobiaceae bacterium]|nr:hypothetical protein [Longimicrobiaceae bacterium]
MYQHCIFCSGLLGSNDVVEHFPVGRMLAFDAARGRLWAVCPKCRRWNLAPIEERWEAIETAEKLFRGSPLRVHSENVGMAKLADGTHMVRVGQALPGEFASWRYGRQMGGRRRTHVVEAGVGVGGFSLLVLHYSGMLSMLGAGSTMLPFWLGSAAYYGWGAWKGHIQPQQVLAPIEAGESTYGAPLVLRRMHLNGARFVVPALGEQLALEVNVPSRGRTLRLETEESLRRMVRLSEAATRRMLRRSMVHVNGHGAAPEHLDRAMTIIREEGPDGYLAKLPSIRNPLLPANHVSPQLNLALEMVLNDEEERRAMDGELALLEAAWREAESIAEIADRLPDEPPVPG